MEMSIYYRDPQIGTRRVDFFVEGIISVELKAITKLEDMNYQRAISDHCRPNVYFKSSLKVLLELYLRAF
jgi:hypothetical protein